MDGWFSRAPTCTRSSGSHPDLCGFDRIAIRCMCMTIVSTQDAGDVCVIFLTAERGTSRMAACNAVAVAILEAEHEHAKG